jgi:NAD(P)-dependent dehydrogenase (short-subunit alcohol dehydrogenase family)
MTSMKNKRVLITGPTSGIGKEAALQLAGLGAEVILGCRDIAQGRQTAAEITRLTGSTNVVALHVDTSSQDSIRGFAQQFRKKYRRLHVLINNASGKRGTLPRVESVDDIELTFATNVLGYFLLTQELLDVLKASAPSRLINVASAFASDLDLDDLQFERRPFESFKAYAQSKACDRLLSWALARRLKGTGVTVNAMTPGLITETRLYRNAPADLMQRLRGYSGGRTIAQGADTLVWLASSPAVGGTTNRFFEDRTELKCQFRNRKDEERLWEICTNLTAPHPARTHGHGHPSRSNA